MSKLDLDAPIIPGKSTAGLEIGWSESRALGIMPATATIERRRDAPPFTTSDEHTRIELPEVVVWITNGRVGQIGVREGYRGLFAGKFRIGDPVQDLNELGEIGEDEEDNLIIRGIPGFCFETPCLDANERRDIRCWRIAWMFVHRPEPQNWSPLDT